MARPILEAARAAQRLDQARRAIERLAERDPRLAASLRAALGDDDPDRRAAAARRAVAIIAAVAASAAEADA